MVPVGRGILETGRVMPLGGRRGVVLRSMAENARGQRAYKLEDRKSNQMVKHQACGKDPYGEDLGKNALRTDCWTCNPDL